MKLTHITLQGTMQGPIWWPAGEVCQTEFHKDFAAPTAVRSPWQEEWPGLDEALQSVLSCGDFQGGMGELVGGTLIFHLADAKGFTRKGRFLEDLAAAKPYLADAEA